MYFFVAYSNLPPVVIYGYYATYLIARARIVHVLLPVCTIRMNTGQLPLVLLCTFVWEWSFLLVARYALLVMFKPTSVDARRSL